MDLLKVCTPTALLIFMISPLLGVSNTQYILTTKLGQIKGLVVSTNSRPVYEFKAIPFAKPPIGNLRFRKPEQYGSWNGTLDGTKFSSACVQNQPRTLKMHMVTDEDCLYLNVYVPNNLPPTAKNKSVMVWIHGGGLEQGSASQYDGRYLASSGDVIVVSINYRLNVFGFISSGDSNLPGNYGLWDQRMAIQWVKDNIMDFGGNPYSITIFGESAGGWSVSAQSISSLNSGLFQRAIIQSGTTLASLAMRREENLHVFARECGCFNGTKKAIGSILACLRQTSSKALINAYGNLSRNMDGFKPIIGITVDGELVADEPSKLLANKTSPSFKFFRSLDIIAGTVNDEGMLLTYFGNLLNFNASIGISSDVLCQTIIPKLTRYCFNNLKAVSDAICHQYKIDNGNKESLAEQSKSATEMYGDVFFYAPTIDYLNFHSSNNTKTNTYQYSFESDFFQLGPLPKWLTGANHGSELVFLIGNFRDARSSFRTEEQKLSNTMLTYWTNFAKSGNPNIGSTANVSNWPTYDSTNRRYQKLDVNLTTESLLYKTRMNFWLQTVPGILQPIVQTNSGQLRGMSIQYQDHTVVHFRGIPFAEPPVGNLRFAKPQVVRSWNGRMDAFNYPPSCIQDLPLERYLKFLPNKKFSEDCLYLNLYIPGTISASNKKSVMIWIHGGGYTSGQASVYDGSLLAGLGDVIVATVNYRLGVFGFLASNDSVLKGNYGLWDQRMAIEWIKNNIAFFGGDPSSITIFGESAGGFSVSLQALSPFNKNLFKRVIAQSGTPLVHMAVHTSPPNLVFMYAKALNCTNVSTTEMVDCLRAKQPYELHNLFSSINREYYQLNGFLSSYVDIPLKPTVDGELIPDNPLKLVTDKLSPSYQFFRSLDMIIGTTNGEGSLLMTILDILKINSSSGITSKVLCDVLASGHAQEFPDDQQEAKQRICNKYKVENGNTTNLIEQGKNIFNMFGDDLFVSYAVELLNYHAVGNNKRTYQYLFSRKLPPQIDLFPVPQWFNMASHSSEISYMFGLLQIYDRNLGLNISSDDWQLMKTMITYWSNFAKFGDPNSKPLPDWPQFTNREKSYIEFGSDTSVNGKKKLWSDRMKLWFELRKLDYVLPEPGISKASSTDNSMYIIGICLFLSLLYYHWA